MKLLSVWEMLASGDRYTLTGKLHDCNLFAQQTSTSRPSLNQITYTLLQTYRAAFWVGFLSIKENNCPENFVTSSIFDSGSCASISPLFWIKRTQVYPNNKVKTRKKASVFRVLTRIDMIILLVMKVTASGEWPLSRTLYLHKICESIGFSKRKNELIYFHIFSRQGLAILWEKRMWVEKTCIFR